MMNPYPTDLQLSSDRKLTITWSDGMAREYPVRHLRDACPCATCREKRAASLAPRDVRSLPVLTPAEMQPLTIIRMRPVGNYAYSITFSDDHDTGIFTFELLRQLGVEAN